MKYIFALSSFLCSVLFLFSCNSGANPPLPVAVAPDSSSYGSDLWIAFGGDSMTITDYMLNNIPVYTLNASDVYIASDSMWEFRMQATNTQSKEIAMNLTAEGPSPTGAFTVTSNTSTLTDYLGGANLVYSIGIGSVVTLNTSTYPLTGKMTLNLYYNHTTLVAIDSFAINN